MGKTERHIQNSKKFGDKLKGLTLELDETMVLNDVVPLRAFKRHHRETLRYGNFSPTFPEVLLAHASPIDWPIVVKHANMTSSRDSIRISFTIDSCKMTSYCRSCAGPIENPPDNHDHCIACLSLAHAEAALEQSDYAQCAYLPLRVLRTRQNVARGLFRVRPTAANMPLVGPPPPLEGGDDNLARNLLRWLFPSPSVRRKLCFLRPGGRGGLHVHFSLREGGMG